MKVDKLMIPILNTIKWSSTGAMETMKLTTKALDYSERFF
jgi:hypothetical protein